MYYYEIAFQITIKENLHQKNVIEKISSGIDYCLFENENPIMKPHIESS